MQCPLCSSEDYNLFHDRVWSLDGGQVLRCQSCDVTFIHPMMDEEQEREFYKSYNEHVKKRGVALSGSTKELHEKSLAVAAERVTVIGDLFRNATDVLEVGAATGAFLTQLPDKTCTVVEPADDNREFARQFAAEVYADIEDIPTGRRFDIICMFHVFEHIRQPASFLDSCRKLLRSGGWIIIEVPHSADPLISLYQCSAYKDFYFQPMHPFIHSVESLRTIFSAQGFSEKQVIYHQRYGLVNHLNWLATGQPGGNAEWQALLGENREYRAALEKAGQTDTIFYIAEISDGIC